MIDRLPQALSDRLPGFDPDGAVRVYAQPHFSDLFHAGYVTVPFGVRWKITDHIELDAEARSYFAYGSGPETGDGISNLTTGVKTEHLLPPIAGGDLSAGVDFRTPLGQPPLIFTDGYRHLQPYLATTRSLVPRWRLLGYASLGADLRSHADLPSNFGRNQLHSNTLAFTTGLAREWLRLHVSLTGRIATTELISRSGRQNFTLLPEVAVPLRRSFTAPTQIYFVVGNRTLWGPDGRISTVSTSLRFSFQRARAQTAKP